LAFEECVFEEEILFWEDC